MGIVFEFLNHILTFAYQSITNKLLIKNDIKGLLLELTLNTIELSVECYD